MRIKKKEKENEKFLKTIMLLCGASQTFFEIFLKVPSLARSVPKPLKVSSLARSVPKPPSIFGAASFTLRCPPPTPLVVK